MRELEGETREVGEMRGVGEVIERSRIGAEEIFFGESMRRDFWRREGGGEKVTGEGGVGDRAVSPICLFFLPSTSRRSFFLEDRGGEEGGEGKGIIGDEGGEEESKGHKIGERRGEELKGGCSTGWSTKRVILELSGLGDRPSTFEDSFGLTPARSLRELLFPLANFSLGELTERGGEVKVYSLRGGFLITSRVLSLLAEILGDKAFPLMRLTSDPVSTNLLGRNCTSWESPSSSDDKKTGEAVSWNGRVGEISFGRVDEGSGGE